MIELTLINGDVIELDNLDENDAVESVSSNDTGIPDGLIFRYIETGNVKALQEYIYAVTDNFTSAQIIALSDAGFSLDTIAENVYHITVSQDADEWLDSNEDDVFGEFANHDMYDYVRGVIDPDDSIKTLEPEGVEVLSDGTVIDYSALI